MKGSLPKETEVLRRWESINGGHLHYQLSCLCKWATVKSLKADVSGVSPSPKRSSDNLPVALTKD